MQTTEEEEAGAPVEPHLEAEADEAATPEPAEEPQSPDKPDPNIDENGIFRGGVYVLRNDETGRTYVGCTNSFARRIRQHRGELVGGAKATKCSRSWRYHVQVTGFTTRSMALSFEWHVKHHRFPKAAFENEHWPPTRRRRKQIDLLLRKFGGDKFPNLTMHMLDPDCEEPDICDAPNCSWKSSRRVRRRRRRQRKKRK
jgi:predicted GIY-YIG superfamily endonuclease